jgi:hypothetical protein
MSPAGQLLKAARIAYGGGRRVAASTPLRLLVFAVLALVAAWPLLASAPALNDFRDAHVLAHYESFARDSVLRWHQAPLWDPYYCGGMYVLGTPQARFLSPTFLLTLVFGETRGESLTAFAMILVGLEGAFRYARSRRATSLGAMWAAPVFALSGMFATAPELGWVGFFGFELLPWIALGVRRALARERAGVVMAAAGMAWCVGFGGTYPAPIAALWCGFEVVEWIVHVALRRRSRGVRPSRGRVLLAGVGMAALAALLAAELGAVRLWPIADTLRAAPRVIGGAPGNGWRVLEGMLFLPRLDDTENATFFVGWIVLPVVLAGLLRRSSLGLAILGVLWCWLAAGYEARPSLFDALRQLPVYSTLRYPERFLVAFALVLSVLAALGVTALEARARSLSNHGRPRRLLVTRLVLALATLALALNLAPDLGQFSEHADARVVVAPPVDDEAPGPFHQARGNRWALAYYEPMNRGSLSCWEAYPVPQSPLLRGDRASEAWVLDEEEGTSAGTVVEKRWSPQAIDLDVDLARPATVAINQNWHAGWRASAGEVKSEHGLLTVALPAGRRTLSLGFSPRSATGGALTSLAALAVLFAIALEARKRRFVRGRREAGVFLALIGAPLIPLLATAMAVHEPSATEPLLTLDGRPVIADAIGEGAVRIDVKLAGDVTLEAATLSDPEPRAGSDVTLELDWRRDEAVPRDVGVFVHIDPSSGPTIEGDHVLLSSVLDLEDAPRGKTLRDVLPIHVPENATGKTFKVWVGLWRVRREGARLHVLEPGHAIVEDNRILAVQFVVR